MSNYSYEQAFGDWDKTTPAMQKAIARWFEMYYAGTASDASDPCQRIPYTVVSKLVKAVFGEYQASASAPFGGAILKSLDGVKNRAMQLALVGGSCFLKPCPDGAGFSFTLVPRNRVLIFGRNAEGSPVDIGLWEKSTEGGWYYTLLERRTVDKNGYLTITNKLCRSRDAQNLGTEVPLANVPAYSAYPAHYCYEKPVGSVGLAELRLPALNCVDGSQDAVAVYAPAEGLIANIDRNEAQLCGEFDRGESRIIASRDLLDRELGLNSHLFVGLDDDAERVGLTVFSPALRETAFLARKQEYLRNVESMLGLKRGMLSDANVEDRTATEITASTTEYALTVMQLQRMWQETVEEVLALCALLSELYGLPDRVPGTVQYDWGNGNLYDQEKTWADYMEMVARGMLKPEVALAWRFGLQNLSQEQIRAKLMPN